MNYHENWLWIPETRNEINGNGTLRTKNFCKILTFLTYNTERKKIKAWKRYKFMYVIFKIILI
jgi:hypothetical protein